MMRRAPKTALLMAAAFIGVAACDIEGVTDTLENTPPTAVASTTSDSVSVGTTVTVDGSASTDPDGDALTFQWAFTSTPSGSAATLSGADTETATFTPDSAGEYVVELTVSDGTASSTDDVAVTAHLDTELSGTITSDTTLSDVGQPYRVTGSLTIDAGLTVEPGVRVEFDSDVSVSVGTDGWLNAVGTASDPIAFTGTAETAGHWRGIGFRSNNTSNELTHVEIAYGGGGSLFSIAGDGNVGVESGARVTITNAHIHHSGASGVYAESDAALPGFADNTLDSNAGAPVTIPFRLMGALDGGSAYSDNSAAYVSVYSTGVSSGMSVSALDVPYRIDGNSAVNADMTIAPGARFEFTSGSGFYVDADGSLAAVGEDGSPIVFVGADEMAGYWRGIGFRSNHSLNELTYVEVAHGGSDSQFSISVIGNVAVENGARLKVTNSTFRDGSHYGLATEGTAQLPDFEANTFADNAEGQVQIPLRLAGQMDSGSSFSAGASPFVRVYDSSVDTDMTLSNLDAPYRISGNSAISAAMAIDPGAVLEFESDAGMYANTEGSISAVGTETDTIVITGVQELAGTWRGLGFRSNNLANELTYVSIGYGGGSSQFSISVTGNVGIEDNARVAITNSVIHHSGAYGVASESLGILEDFSANRFEGNATASVNLPMPMAGMLDGATEFSTDESGYVAIYNGTVTSGMEFSRLDVPYRISGNSAFSAAVTAEAGAHFEFTSTAGFYADTDGSFAAIGTASDTIRFTGVQGVQGAWRGIGFRSNDPANQLTYVEVGHGGSSAQFSIGDAANVGIEGGARLSVTEASIHDSAGWGLWAGTDANVTTLNVTYSNNASGDKNF